jgi:hypothetical protein
MLNDRINGVCIIIIIYYILIIIYNDGADRQPISVLFVKTFNPINMYFPTALRLLFSKDILTGITQFCAS